MSESLTKAACAKVNLWLRILGRREDGFHEIETRMLEVALADELEMAVTARPGVDFQCSEPGVPVNESNLVLKAVRLLEAETGRAFGLRIHLRKHIPHGAGLGGGSSDAAAALAGIDELLALELGRERLLGLAQRIGSDVAFFLLGGACDCTGRGERVAPVAFAEPLRLLLVKPPFAVPTPWAYQQWAKSAEVPGLSYEPQVFPWGTMVNDLERPVFGKHLVLGVMKQWLRSQPGVQGALMSGSGSTVFAVLEPEAPAEELIRQIREEFGDAVWTCLTSAVNRPLEH